MNETLDTFTRAHGDFCRLAGDLEFTKTNPLHFHVMALYGSILEYGTSMINLANAEPRTSIPIIFRSLLDASLDFMNLCEDPPFGHRLEINFLRGEQRFLGEALRGENHYLQELGEQPIVRERHKAGRERLKELKGQGYSGVTMEEKFQLLDMHAEYYSIYKMLNNHVHNSIDALRERHAQLNDEGFDVIFFKDVPLQRMEMYFGMALEITMRCTEKLHEIFQSERQNDVGQLRSKIDEFRSKQDGT